MKTLIKNPLAFVALGLLLFSSACKKADLELDDLPICIQQKIDDIKSKPVAEPPIKIERWKIDDETFNYYFTSDCCDEFNFLYDESCGEVCAPSGGISGAGSGTCPTFDPDIEKTIVWEDER